MIGESPYPEASILFVDDETGILNSLRRLFRKSGWTIHLAESGAEGLAILEKSPVDLIVSDMRMPEMSGAEFLTDVAQKYPDTVRILLTGYAELESAVDAINLGKIYAYVSKPWDDQELFDTINKGLHLHFLEKERDELLKITKKQNVQLREFNQTLEQKVKDRTSELEQLNTFLDSAYSELKQSYNSTVSVFTNMIELREGKRAGHSRRVAQYARELAEALGINLKSSDDVYLAALMHNIGLLSLPDVIASKPYPDMSFEEKEKYQQHPALGETALQPIPPLHKAATFIRSYRENIDGSGFPDKLKGEDIPLGARILSVLNDFDELQIGFKTGVAMTEEEALEYLVQHAGKYYDKKVVATFVKNVRPHDKPEKGKGKIVEKGVGVDDVAPGMRLARDLITPQGILLLAKGQAINDVIIERIHMLEKETHTTFKIFINEQE